MGGTGNRAGDASGLSVTATGGAVARKHADRAADIFNARDFGAFGDGSSHTVQATLGITTLAGLAAYTTAAGVKPYAWIASGYPFGRIVNLRVSANVAAGATAIPHTVMQAVGLRFKPGVVASGTTIPSITTYGLTVGTGVTGPGLAAGTTVTAIYGGSIQLSQATTAATVATDVWTFAQASPGFGAVPKPGNVAGSASLTTYYCTGIDQIPTNIPTGISGNGLAAGSTVMGATASPSTNTCTLNNLSPAPTATVGTYQNATLAASFTAYLVDTTGVYQGMSASGTNVVAGTYVEYVNQSTHEIRLSKPTQGLIPGGATLTFAWDAITQIAAGMQVMAQGVPSGATVASVGSGSVTLSTGTSAALTAATPTDAATPVNDGLMVTYFRPYTDAEVAAMQMDQIGINAAIQAAQSYMSAFGTVSQSVGGTVRLPGGRYQVDNPIILPNPWQFASLQPHVGLAGEGWFGTFIEATRDFGLDVPLVSTGDPAADVTNLRGTYANVGANFVTSRMVGVTLQASRTQVGTVSHLKGVRPRWSGAPVLMTGLRQGARLHLMDVVVRDFNTGIFFGQEDHTEFRNVFAQENFIGFRVGQANVSLYGDNQWDRISFWNNDFANISVAWNGYLDGGFIAPYMSYAPYAIWLEPGSGAGTAIAKVTMIGKPNLEQHGVAIIKDGNRKPDYYGNGASRSIGGLRIDNAFTSRDTTYMPAGGGAWNAYIDVFAVSEFSITGIVADAWQPILTAGSPGAPLMLVDRIGENAGYAGAGSGSLLLSGDGLSLLFNNYAAQGQSLVSGYGGTSGIFFNTGAYQRVAFEIPGMGLRAKLMPILTAAASMAKGTVFEYVASGGHLQVQPFGTAASNNMLAGFNLQAWTSANPPSGKYTAVQVRGTETPVAVGAAAAVGTLLYPPAASSSTPGVAATSAQTTNALPLGIVSDANGGSASQIYVQTPN